MTELTFQWTDGSHPAFRHFYAVTEAYYSRIVGGKENRAEFTPFNASAEIPVVLLAFMEGQPVACAGLKRYSDLDAEVKRLWVEPAFRGRGIASALMDQIEEKARSLGYRRVILQTRPIMTDAVALYTKRDYVSIPNYPPYNKLPEAVCYAKSLE